MFTHVVMFKLKDRADLATAVANIRGMEGTIPTLRQIEVGVDLMQSGRSYDLVLITRFDDRAGYDEYATHPHHLPVLAYMGRVMETAAAVDFESV